MRTVVLLCVHLAEGVPGPAAVFLKEQGVVHSWPDKTDAELQILAADVFLAADSDYIGRFRIPMHHVMWPRGHAQLGW